MVMQEKFEKLVLKHSVPEENFYFVLLAEFYKIKLEINIAFNLLIYIIL